MVKFVVLEEGLGIVALAAEAVDCADGGELQALEELAVAAVQLYQALGVGDVVGDEGVVHHGDVVELVLARK